MNDASFHFAFSITPDYLRYPNPH